MPYKNTEEVISALSTAGYKDVKKVSNTKLKVLIPTSDRLGALNDIAKKLRGRYNPKGSGSSIGRTEIQSKWIILVKTKGSGGSGAGSAATRLTESAQCLYCACRWMNLPYTVSNLKKVAKNIAVDENLSNMLTKLDDDWIASSMAISEKLHEKYGRKSYVFHRGDRWVDTLENHWKKLNREERKFSNINKWLPADIYMTTSKGRSLKIQETTSILELNKLLLSAYRSGDIIGVSLKKVKPGNVRFTAKNITSDRSEYNFHNFTLSKKDFFSSGDGYIFYDKGSIQFRRFGNSWQGEIKGKFANMGKIGGGVISRILKDSYNIDMIPQSQFTQINDDDIQRFWKYYKTLQSRPLTYKKFREEIKKKDVNWFISKAMSTQLLFFVDDLKTKEKNSFVSKLLNYAGSESELSAPYVKVY